MVVSIQIYDHLHFEKTSQDARRKNENSNELLYNICCGSLAMITYYPFV